MAPRKKQSEETQPATDAAASAPRPRMVKLIVKNFRCIGAVPVEIDLDDIVVLVGANNVGKSSILKAYQVIMSEGSAEGKLSLDDFPNSRIDPNALPEIELHTIVYGNLPGAEWIADVNGEKLVKEKWTWKKDNEPPDRRGYNVTSGDWAKDTDKEKVPWGAANYANAMRPQPHHVGAFDAPEKQAQEIVRILETVLKARIKSFAEEAEKVGHQDYKDALEAIKKIQAQIISESRTEIGKIENELTSFIGKVFPGHKVEFDAPPQENFTDTITLFKENPQLRMGPSGGYLSTIDKQGSGARRTLLWTALRLVEESGGTKKRKSADTEQRPHVLLLDEPEICLHPNAIREACDLLYGLPNTKNWQVMITTHSPCFVDFARDNTTIVRVDKKESGEVQGATIFRPKTAKLDDDDKRQLKLMNICDPYVAEFFFGGKTIVVEGDTEYTAFKYLIAKHRDQFKDIHIIRARGKSTIVSIAKILNHFGANYAVLHDSDKKTITDEGVEKTNPAWSVNEKILEETKKCPQSVRLVSSIPNFELAYLGKETTKDKPYNVLQRISDGGAIHDTLKTLLESLLDKDKPLPVNAVAWNEIKQVEDILSRL